VKYKWTWFFKDEHGKFSSMRLGFLITIIPVMFVWALLSIQLHKLESIPVGVCSLIGVLASGKISQSWISIHYGTKKKTPKINKKINQGFWATIWAKIKTYIPFLNK
jgi:hypothetical protein